MKFDLAQFGKGLIGLSSYQMERRDKKEDAQTLFAQNWMKMKAQNEFDAQQAQADREHRSAESALDREARAKEAAERNALTKQGMEEDAQYRKDTLAQQAEANAHRVKQDALDNARAERQEHKDMLVGFNSQLENYAKYAEKKVAAAREGRLQAQKENNSASEIAYNSQVIALEEQLDQVYGAINHVAAFTNSLTKSGMEINDPSVKQRVDELRAMVGAVSEKLYPSTQGGADEAEGGERVERPTPTIDPASQISAAVTGGPGPQYPPGQSPSELNYTNSTRRAKL